MTTTPDDTDQLPAGPGPRRAPWLVAAGTFGVLVVLYLGDLLFSSADIPRRTTVAGVAVGGMSKPTARSTLSVAFENRAARPVSVRAGDAVATFDAGAAGLGVDVDATVERAGGQPLNPVTRLASLFTTREVDPVGTGATTVAQTLEGLRPQLDRTSVEGTVVFRGAEPVGVAPVAGRRVDAEAGARAVLTDWLDRDPVVLPTAEAPVTVTPEGVETALRDVARPAVAAPVLVAGDGVGATLAPDEVGRVLTFAPDGAGGLRPGTDAAAARTLLAPRLARSETRAQDATYTFTGATPTIVPAVAGRAVDWDRTLAGLLPALGRPPGPADGRTLPAVYAVSEAEVTTAELEAAGPPEVIGEFETRNFAADSGRNIRRIAEVVNGATVGGGETFSLNGYTSPRNAANGYVPAGIIDDGAPGQGVGGGVSQFATTLYNASYFAGFVDVAHSEHSYYISRYPPGREATVFEGSIDLRFRNDGPTPVIIRTAWTPSSIRVQIYGKKRVEVTSQQSPRFAPTPPPSRDLSDRPTCKASNGVAGFSITDTRTIRDLVTGEVRTLPRTVRYEPQPAVTCGGGA